MSLSKWMNNLCFALIMASDFSANRGRLKSTKLSCMVTLTQTVAPCVTTVKTSMSFISSPLIDVPK